MSISISQKSKKLKRMTESELKNQLFYTKLLGSILSRGRKIWAFNYFIRAMHYVKRDLDWKRDNKVDPHLYLLTALNNLCPSTHLVYFRFGTAKHPIPFLITVRKQVFYAVKWIFKIMRKYKFSRRNIPLDTFASMIIRSYDKVGPGFDKKEETHKLAEANRHLLKLIK